MSYQFPFRQYLSNEGIGFGTQFQRQKQYSQVRVSRAQEDLFRKQVEKSGASVGELSVSEKKHVRRSKATQALERLAEDLILEAMSKGEFDNLKGAGKPLKQEQHVYIGEDNFCERIDLAL